MCSCWLAIPSECSIQCNEYDVLNTCTQVLITGGASMPMVGFGTAATTAQSVTWALQTGYRLIDSAQVI